MVRQRDAILFKPLIQRLLSQDPKRETKRVTIRPDFFSAALQISQIMGQDHLHFLECKSVGGESEARSVRCRFFFRRDGEDSFFLSIKRINSKKLWNPSVTSHGLRPRMSESDDVRNWSEFALLLRGQQLAPIPTMTTMRTNESLPIYIMPHHLELSPALIARVREKLGPLVRIGGDAVRADVTLRLRHGRGPGRMFTASARLTLPGGDIHASATRANLYKAITALEVRLARRLRKRKTRIENRIEMNRPHGGTTSAARLEETLLPA